MNLVDCQHSSSGALLLSSGDRRYHLWLIAEIGEEAVQADLRPVNITLGAWQACCQASARWLGAACSCDIASIQHLSSSLTLPPLPPATSSLHRR